MSRYIVRLQHHQGFVVDKRCKTYTEAEEMIESATLYPTEHISLIVNDDGKETVFLRKEYGADILHEKCLEVEG